MKRKINIFILLILPFALFAQEEIIIGIHAPLSKQMATVPVKNITAIIQVLDSTIRYDYSSSWDYTEKEITTLRHWEDGSPYELINYLYNSGTSAWDNNYKYYIIWHDSAVYKQEIAFPWNSNLLMWNPDTMYDFNYVNYISYQFWFLYSDVSYSKTYDEISNQYTGGNRYRPTIFADTLYTSLYMDAYNSATQQWDPSAVQSFTYESNNLVQTYLHQLYNSSTFIYENETYYSYVYVNGKMTQRTQQSWATDHWENTDRDTYVYDVNGNRIETIDYDWNGGTSTWDYNYRDTYAYTGNLLMERINEDWNGSAWIKDYRYVYTYDGNGNQLTNRYDLWDGSAWEYLWRNTFVFDANDNKLTQLNEDWLSGTSVWRNDYRYSYTYNTNNEITYKLEEDWVTDHWENDEKEQYSYDVNNNLTLESYATWDNIGGAWDFDNKIEYYWSQYDANNVEDLFSNDFNMFPNPSNGLITIDRMNGEFQKMTILDAQGKIIVEKNLEEQKEQINLARYGKGLYVIILSNEEGESSTRKLMVQ